MRPGEAGWGDRSEECPDVLQKALALELSEGAQLATTLLLGPSWKS